MGGTAWDVEVRWAGSVAASLEAAKADVLARRAYGKRFAPGQPGGATIAEVVANAGPDGTASVLDVTSVGDRPGPCQVGPLPDDELEDIFGTNRPSRADAKEKVLEVHALLDRGEAAYVLIYEADAPVSVVFLGYSFD